MYNKTTGTLFLKYGAVSNHDMTDESLECKEITTKSDEVKELFRYNRPVYLEPRQGMGMLRITDDPYGNNLESFAIHRRIRINPGMSFQIVSMHGYISYDLYIPKDAAVVKVHLENPVKYDHIRPTMSIKEILAYYYVVKRPGYEFPGEVTEFYELTYVDQGCLTTTVDGKSYEIKENDLIVYGPGQFHDQKVTSDTSCSYLTVIFTADGIDRSKLLNRIISCSRETLVDIGDFVKASDSGTIYQHDLMISALQYLIINITMDDSEKVSIKPTSPINQHYEDQLIEEIIEYINKYLTEPLPIEQICNRFSISRSTLQNLFKNNLHIPPKQYINDTKLARAKILIRQGEHTISEISGMLGFTSVHYFSRKFTSHFGITPSEYSHQIYDRSEGNSL